jgi:ADP-heptose:LPS heptosyltransferase
VGRFSLKETAGLIAASGLFIGCDTGPMHIAVAVGTPLVALFGAADPLRTGPFRRGDSVIYKGVDCAPCRKRECTVAGHPCMAEISVAEAITVVRCQSKNVR